MRATILIFIIILIVIIAGFYSGVLVNSKPVEENTNYGISVMTDKAVYAVGEHIRIKMKIFNYSEENIVFHFNSSQRYDFIIEDEEGEEIWRWSADKMFSMVLGEEILGTATPQTVYSEEYNGKLNSGYYRITAFFTASKRPISGSVMIQIK